MRFEYISIMKGRKNRSRLDAGGEQVTLPASIGFAENNEVLDHVKDVLNAADKALYHARQQGRDRVYIYQ